MRVRRSVFLDLQQVPVEVWRSKPLDLYQVSVEVWRSKTLDLWQVTTEVWILGTLDLWQVPVEVWRSDPLDLWQVPAEVRRSESYPGKNEFCSPCLILIGHVISLQPIKFFRQKMKVLKATKMKSAHPRTKSNLLAVNFNFMLRQSPTARSESK